MKHVAIKHDHFGILVDKGTIKIMFVDTKSQVADVFTNLIEDN